VASGTELRRFGRVVGQTTEEVWIRELDREEGRVYGAVAPGGSAWRIEVWVSAEAVELSND
jgi:hypothetical protein